MHRTQLVEFDVVEFDSYEDLIPVNLPKAVKTARGFIVVEHESYTDQRTARLIGESSAIGDYADSLENPGSSFLWVGNDHHVNSEEVKELIEQMQHWLHKRLKMSNGKSSG